MISEELSLRALPKGMTLTPSTYPSPLSSSLLSSQSASRKVSFAENEAIALQHDGAANNEDCPDSQSDSQSLYDKLAFAPYQGIHMNVDTEAAFSHYDASYSQMVFNEEQRVISNETIDSLPGKNELMKHKSRSRSRSLPSLSRSGDLKSLLIEGSSESQSTTLHENSNQIKVPSVSEDCLLSRNNINRSLYYVNENESFTESQSNSIPSNNVVQQLHHQPSCSGSGWGQFVEFIPVDHKSPRRKQLSPRSRRRNSSSSRKLLFRRHPEKALAKKLKISIKKSSTRKSHLTSLYTNNNNNRHEYNKDNNIQNSASTNDIVKAFHVQLSL